jgi:hypothetical protein
MATALNFFPADSRAEVPNKDGYDLAAIATDGTIYLGRIKRVINGMKFIDFIAIDDPDSEKSEYAFMEVFRCSDRTFKHSDSGTWKKAEPDSIGEQMMTWGCP